MLRGSTVTAVLLAVAVVGAGAFVAGLPSTEPTSADAATDAPAADGAALQGGTCDYQALYNETIDGVVQVRTGDGLGSGFVYRLENGTSYVVTNQHVVGERSTVLVQFSRGDSAEGTVLGTTALTDLAVVRVGSTPDYVETLPFAEDEPRPGEQVAAFGSPFGLEGTITSGIVSGVDREMPTNEGVRIPSTVQTDAPINPGNSGGPLVRCADGAVLGVNRAGGAEDIGFAIPADVVQQVAPVLVEEGEFAYPWLGIQATDVNSLIANASDLNVTRGVMVVRTVEGSPAAGNLQGATGIEEVSGFRVPTGGDVVLAINDTRVNTTQDLQSYLLTETRPGDTVELTVLRNGSETTVDVTVGERPEEVGAADAGEDYSDRTNTTSSTSRPASSTVRSAWTAKPRAS